MRLRWGVNLPGPFFVIGGGKQRKPKPPSDDMDKVAGFLVWVAIIYVVALFVFPLFTLILTVVCIPIGWLLYRYLRWLHFKYAVTDDLRGEGR